MSNFELTIAFKDVIVEEDSPELAHHRTGCFVSYDGSFVDALMIKEAGVQQIKPESVTFSMPDNETGAEPRVVVVVKDLMEGEPYAGSVSIPRNILLEGEPGRSYQMWITLFDDPNDDEYDGAMGMDDDEQPRVLLELSVTEKVDE